MKKLKIVTIVGTRPEIIRLSEIIKKLRKYYNHTLVHTGQNYDPELSQIFFRDLDLKSPEYFLDCSKPSFTAAESIGAIISKTDALLRKLKPDALLVLGDTNSCLSALAAKRLKIPIFHLEAGNRCFDQRVPEEINRKIVDNIADINLTYSSIAREYLINEGFRSDQVIKVGSPMQEVLNKNLLKIKESNILSKLKLHSDNYFLVSVHREENVDDDIKFKDFLKTLKLIYQKYKNPIIVSTHPRTRKKLNLSKVQLPKAIIFSKPLSFSDYNALQLNAKVVLSDSGTISEESSLLGFKALNLREAHERPESMEEGVVPLVGLKSDDVIKGIHLHLSQDFNPKIVYDYLEPDLSEKISRLILSYINYVNRVVWKKY